MRSMRAATVVVLPDPGGPVTSTRPFSSSAKRSTCGGSPRSSRSGISGGTRRTTIASEPRWRWIATRKRPSPVMLNPELASPVVGEVVLPGAVEHARRQRLDHAGRGHLEGCRPELAVDAHVRHGAGLQVQVRSLDLVQVREELFQLGHLAYIGRPRPRTSAEVGELGPHQGRGDDASRPGTAARGRLGHQALAQQGGHAGRRRRGQGVEVVAALEEHQPTAGRSRARAARR